MEGKKQKINYIESINKHYFSSMNKKYDENKLEFLLSEDFLEIVVIDFENWCKNEMIFNGNIFEYNFVINFIEEFKNKFVFVDYKHYTITIEDETIQFPRFEIYTQMKEVLENYLITILYFKAKGLWE